MTKVTNNPCRKSVLLTQITSLNKEQEILMREILEDQGDWDDLFHCVRNILPMSNVDTSDEKVAFIHQHYHFFDFGVLYSSSLSIYMCLI